MIEETVKTVIIWLLRVSLGVARGLAESRVLRVIHVWRVALPVLRVWLSPVHAVRHWAIRVVGLLIPHIAVRHSIARNLLSARLQVIEQHVSLGLLHIPLRVQVVEAVILHRIRDERILLYPLLEISMLAALPVSL